MIWVAIFSVLPSMEHSILLSERDKFLIYGGFVRLQVLITLSFEFCGAKILYRRQCMLRTTSHQGTQYLLLALPVMWGWISGFRWWKCLLVSSINDCCRFLVCGGRRVAKNLSQELSDNFYQGWSHLGAPKGWCLMWYSTNCLTQKESIWLLLGIAL